MSFDRTKDKIAVTIPKIKLRLSADGLLPKSTWYDNEIYFVSVAVDAKGASQKQIEFGHAYWPAIRRFEECHMTGHGALVYGPKNPGEFVAYSILVMESDEDVRRTGARAKEALGIAGRVLDLASLLPAIKTYATALSVAKTIGEFVAGQMTKKEDDRLIKVEGVHLRDYGVPYNINRTFTHKSRWVEIHDKVLALDAPNGEAIETEAVSY